MHAAFVSLLELQIVCVSIQGSYMTLNSLITWRVPEKGKLPNFGISSSGIFFEFVAKKEFLLLSTCWYIFIFNIHFVVR